MSLDNFLTKLIMLYKSTSSFSYGLSNNIGFIIASLLSSTPGLLPRDKISFSTLFSSSKFYSRVSLLAFLKNMDIEGCRLEL
jgi:hypothetical protein